MSRILGLFLQIAFLSGPLAAAVITAQADAAWKAAVEQARQQAVPGASPELQPVSESVLQRGTPVILSMDSPRREGLPLSKGILHHWIGTLFVPDSRRADVVSVLQNFDRYPEVYQPAVVRSELTSHQGDTYEYKLRLVQKGFGVKAGMVGTFRSTFQNVGAQEGYSTTEAVELHELTSTDAVDTEVVPFERAHGWVERSFLTVRYRELGGGVEIQLQSLTLSRDVPAMARWAVNPLIKRFAAETMATTLLRLGDAVAAAGPPSNLEARAQSSQPRP